MYLALLATTDEPAQGSIWPTLILMALIFVAMYFLMIRPQRKRMREAQELQRSMEEGDEVITNAGVYGFITAIDGDVIWLEIAENVEIRVARAAIARVIQAVDTPESTAAPAPGGTDIEEILDGDDTSK
jgi:preprotein translocase subunit YajC